MCLVVYQSEREDTENINRLDFPKGKADEGEKDTECANHLFGVMGVHLAAEGLKVESFFGRHNNPEYNVIPDLAETSPAPHRLPVLPAYADCSALRRPFVNTSGRKRTIQDSPLFSFSTKCTSYANLGLAPGLPKPIPSRTWKVPSCPSIFED